MIICRLMTTLFITVLHTMTGDCSTEDSSSIARETIHVNVGKRVRMECELANSITTSNMKVSSIIVDIRRCLHRFSFSSFHLSLNV